MSPEPRLCPRCGGEQQSTNLIIPTLPMNSNRLIVRIGGIFSQKYTPLNAWVCLTCGYTELYAESPGNLR